MPPHAVPAALSAAIQMSASLYWLILLCIPLACIVVIAAQTVKALLELKPDAGGT